jgi:hypothetical protein
MDELNLDSAIDSIASSMGQGSDTPPEPESPPPASPQEPTPAPPTTPQRKVIKPAEDSAEVPAAPEGETPASPAPTPQSQAPKTWRPEAAAAWEALPDTVRQEILKREEDVFRGIEEYKGKAAQASALTEAVQPFMPILQQHGIPPATMVKNLLNAQYLLTAGSQQQKTAMMQKLAQDYGVEWGSDATMMDPQVSHLEQRLARVESDRIQQIQQQTMREVETFASELGEDGKPLRPYFDDVADDIVGLIKSNQASDLKSAYEKAIWLNPVTREKEMQRLQQASAAAAKRAAEEARKAEAATVKTSPRPVTADSATGTMDDTMAATLKAIKSRAA